MAGAKCAGFPDRVAVFHGLIGGVLEELKLHAGYAESLGIDLEHVIPRPATLAYTDFLAATAWSAEPAEIVAAMTPCMRLYAYLGASLAPAAPENPYRDWVETYCSSEFEELAAGLEALLDELAEDPEPVSDAYRYAMRCELEFFDSAARRR